MRLQSVNIYRNTYKIYADNTKNQHNASSANVTFGYSLPFKNQNLICFSDGLPMISHKVFRNYAKKIEGKNGREMLAILSNYQKYLRPTEKKCFESLSKLSEKFPEDNIQDLVIKLKPRHKQKLHNKQFNLLNRLDKLADKLPPSKAEELIAINSNARRIIIQKNTKQSFFIRKPWMDNLYGLCRKPPCRKIANATLNFSSVLINKLPQKSANKLKAFNEKARFVLFDINPKPDNFKRKIWVNDIYNFCQTLSNKKLANKIYAIAVSFPTASSDESAFIVKYAGRRPQEIGERFLSEAEVSIDHLQPHSKGGISDWTNYVPKARGPNSVEGSESVYQRVKNNPSMVKNVQLAMNRIIGLINSGRKRLQPYYDFPTVIAENYRQLTKIPGTNKSLINIDISALKSKEEIEKIIEQNQEKKAYLKAKNSQSSSLNK